MKLQSKRIEDEHEHRIYDEAKTPLQRVLLSGVLPDEIKQQWREAASSLDPLRLVQHVEVLQRAVWRCAEGGPGTTLVHFSLDACVSTSAHLSPGIFSDPLAQGSPDPAETRDWSRSMDDPFVGEWEHIHAYVLARPMASAEEILREWQRRFPGRFVDAHLGILQRRLREIRVHLLEVHAALSLDEMGKATSSSTSSEPTTGQAGRAPVVDVLAVVVPGLASAHAFLPPTLETPLVLKPLAHVSNGASSRGTGERIPPRIITPTSMILTPYRPA